MDLLDHYLSEETSNNKLLQNTVRRRVRKRAFRDSLRHTTGGRPRTQYWRCTALEDQPHSKYKVFLQKCEARDILTKTIAAALQNQSNP